MNCLSVRMSSRVFVLRAAAALALLLVGREAKAATGLLANVPEAAEYTLVYEFPIPASSGGWFANPVPYSYTNTASIAMGSFDRVAYYMELVKASGQTQWVYVSMTAFTTNATRLGIPRNYVLRHNAYDTANPSNATIRSNVSGITETNGCNTVNLEFWPSNYGGQNDYGVPGADVARYDFGDGGAGTTSGHSCMQIHNYGAKQTLFAYNQWAGAGTSNLGVGNQPTGEPDWTFNTSNIGTYTVRTLQILVRTFAAANLPATNVTASSGWMNAAVSVGGTCDVWAYWGDTDQTTNAGLWANSALIGTYSNGQFDVTRQVTGLSGGATNWYTFLASNAVSKAWATPSAKFVTATTPSVDNSANASVSQEEALLRGTLTAGGTADIYLYWGATDGGQSPAYDHVVKLTDVPQGDFSTEVPILSGFSYYYICLASNEVGTAWAPASVRFSPGMRGGAFAYADGLRGSLFQPVTFAQTAVDLRDAAYTLSAARVPTGEKSGTVLAMNEVPGKNVVLTGSAYSWTEFGGSPGDNFVAALSGRFFPPVSGTYNFRWSQDDRGWLFIDTDDNGVFESAEVVGTYAWNGTGNRTLTAGQGYNFMFFSHESIGGDSLAFWYTPPGSPETYVNPSLQTGQWRYPCASTPDVRVSNVPMNAGAVTSSSAVLSGNLYGRGWAFDVTVCWGTADGGENAANWQHRATVGRFQDWDGAVTNLVTGLTSDASYYYTFFVTNALMTAWASPVQTFVTGEVTIEAVDASASETGPDAGRFRVTRPAATTSVALTVNYTVSGTAANGVDYVTLPGSAVIPAGETSAEFTVSPLDDLLWQEGDETVVATLAAGNYQIGAAASALVTIGEGDPAPGEWFLRMPLQFAGYDKAETLVNFPVLVTLHAGLAGFSYDQFLSGLNGDLRFTDGTMTRELAYEIESWDTNGVSRVWVQVPAFTNNATVWMLWRKAGLSAPAYTTDGSVWSADYVAVAHESDGYGTVMDSSPNRNHGAVFGAPLLDVAGVIAGGDQFDGNDDYVTLGTIGRPIDTFTYSAWVKATQNHEIDTQASSGTTGTGGQKYAFEPVNMGDFGGSGLSVGINGVSVYEHGNGYMPPLAVYAGVLGADWNHITVTYVNKQPRIYVNGVLVVTGLTSPRAVVYAPYRIGASTSYGYFNGTMDETRISSVARSANWVWAEYMNAASNDLFTVVGPAQPADLPEIANRPASGVSADAATLNGFLNTTGMAAAAVAVYWGTTDGGTDAAAWANTNWFDSPASAGAFAKSVTGLASGSICYYRFAATNAYGASWAPSSETLLTAAVTLQATDTAAAERPTDTGSFTVSRGASYDAPLTVHYTLSGTAANGVDLAYLSGAVTIPAGAASAQVVITPLLNRNFTAQATDTVTLTLTAAGYISGSPNSGTVTIANWDIATAVGIDVPRNFTSSSADPLTGPEMLLKTGAGQMMLGASGGNTFSGDITVDPDGGILRVGGIPGSSSGTGVTLPGMTAANTVTVKRGGQVYIDDNSTWNSVGSLPDRFGTDGNRPSVKLEGGTLTLNGANNGTTVPQTFGPLNLGSGYSTLSANRNSAGTPELVFSELQRSEGSHVNYTGSSLGASALNVPHIRFKADPPAVGGGGAAGTKTMNVIPGARYGSDWVTYDPVSGVRPLAAAEYNTVAGNDINTAGATENVRMTAALTAFPPLAADKTVNSLLINVAAQAYWSPTNKLTITSGQLISGVPNNQMVINYPSTLTAGSGADASLDVSVFQNITYIRSLITDNGSGKVTLTKNGGADLTLDGNVDNTYSGGTYVNEGRINTGGTAGRRYLGSGPARVDAGLLWLGNAGATANASGDDFVAVNGAQIGVATLPFTGEDTFNIGPGCVIYGSWTAGMGLNALDRGMGDPATTPNITLAPDAVVGHSSQLSGPLNLSLNTVKNLGSNADLYYGLVSDQNTALGSITVGTNTPFKGLSTDRWDRRWSAGTIFTSAGTSEIWLQGMARPGTTPSTLNIGNWTMDGGPVIAQADAAPLTVNVLGNVVLDDTSAVFGDTSAGKPVTFAVKAGARLSLNKPDTMGSGNGVASAVIEDGGTLEQWVPNGINGAVTVKSGGRFQAGNAGGLTGGGAVTFESGSILEISSITGFTGPQAKAITNALPPGQLVRLAAYNYGTPMETLDSYLGDRAPIYEIFGDNRGAANPIVTNTTVLTLNRDAATGAGGMLVNDYANRNLNSAANGILVIGPNGGTIAATSNTTLNVQQRLSLSDHALTIGATNVLDRILLPKLGTVQLSAALGLNTALPDSSITVIPGATLLNSTHALPDESDIIVNGTFLVGGTEVIGSLSGLGLVNLQGNALTVGYNNNSTTFSGALTNTSLTAMFTKNGTGRLDIAVPQRDYTGQFTVNNGVLALSGSGSTTNTGAAAFTVAGSGTLLLDNSAENNANRLTGMSPGITFNNGTLRFVGKDGEASGERFGVATFAAGKSTIDVVNGLGAGSSVDLAFGGFAPYAGAVNFTASNGTLGAAGDNPRVFFDELASGVMGFATVDGAPAYYSPETGVRAFSLGEGTEFDGTADQSGVDTKYTAANLHQPLDAARSVNSLWIDNPGAGNVVNLGSSGAFSLSLASGRLQLSGADDFAFTRSGSSTGTLTGSGNATLYIGVEAGRTLTMGVPLASGGSLVKDGAGLLVLSATNTFPGFLSVNGGAVRYAADGSGDLNVNAVNLFNGSLFDVNGNTDTLGAFNITCGGLTNSVSGGTLTISTLTMGGGPAGTLSFVDTGSGSLKLGGTVTFNALNDPGPAMIAGSLNLNGTRSFVVNNSVSVGADIDMDIPAAMSGSAGQGIYKTGGGVLRLGGNNTFNGNLQFSDNAGCTIFAHPQALGAPATTGRTIFVGTGATLALDGSAGDITVPPLYTNLFLNNVGDWQVGAVRGALMNWSGNNIVPTPVTLMSNSVYLASLKAGDKLSLTGRISGDQDLTINGDGDTELGGVLATGAKGLIKNGTGTLTLSGTGTNTFSGTTTVNAGTLVLAKANGFVGVPAITGAVNVSNGGLLKYADASTNPDQLGAGTVTLYGGGQLDVNGATDTMGALSVSAPGATTDTTNLLNTASGGNLTVASLTVQPAVNQLTRLDTGSGTLTLGGNLTFNAANAGRAVVDGKFSLGGTSRTLTVNTGIHSNYDMAIDAVISGNAGVGMTKAGGGVLRLNGANTHDGVLTINSSSGSVILGHPQALGTPSTARTVTVNSGGTLALDGVDISDTSSRFTLSLNGTGNTRHGGVSGALLNLSGSNTVPCAIALAGATQIASQQAGGKLTLTGAFTGAQTLTFAGPGETALAGVSGAIPSATALIVTSNAVLTLENTVAANNANRIGTMPITLSGGAFRFSHDGGAANFTETVGALTIGPGSNVVFASQAASVQTSALVFASISCAGGTVNFVGEGLGDSDRNRIFITGQGDGMIGPWATINGVSNALYSAARGVYAGTGSTQGVAARGNDPAAVIPNLEAVSALINLPGDSGPISLEGAWTNRVLEVVQQTEFATVVAMTDGATNKTLQTSRLMIEPGKESLTIGGSDNLGTLMALGAGGIVSLENRNAARTLTVNTPIPNNGAAASGLSKFGPGPVVLTGSNSYFGATLINEGTLEFGGPLAQRLDGVISGAGSLVKSGTNQLHLFGANTYTGPTYINAGTVRPEKNNAFGNSAAGTFIASGATLDVGCDKSVGGTRYNDNLNLGTEEFTVSGSGVGDMGVIVNNGVSNQMSAVQRVLLSGDATFGGKARWDIRSGYLFFNDHTLTKTGASEIAIVSVPLYPGSGHLVINQGLVRFESSLAVYGTAANTATVNRGGKLELYNLSPFAPSWSLVLNDGASFQAGTYNTVATNFSIWAGPVTLNGTAFMYGYSSSGMVNWTINGDISGPGSLVRTGSSSSTLWLNGTNNTYAGGTIVSNGVLYAKYPGSLPGYNDGRLTVAGGGILYVHASDGAIGFNAAQLRDLNAASSFKANNAYVSVDTTFADLACPYDLPKLMGLIKQGTNSLALGGNAVLGNVTVYDGALSLGGNNVVSGTLANVSGRVTVDGTNTHIGSAEIYAGSSSLTNGTLTLGPAASLTCGGNFRISTANGSGALYVNGGSFSNSQAAGDANFAFGRETNSYGYFRMTGGSVWARRLQTAGVGDNTSRGRGLVRISGGELTFSEHVLLARNTGCESVLTLDGGTITHTSGNELSLARQGGRSELNICGGTFNNGNMGTLYQPTTGFGTGTGIINLCAGQLTSGALQNSNNSQAYLNFCGGTLAPGADSGAFVPSTMSGVYVFGAITGFTGGAVIDSNGKSIIITAPIRNPTGQGVSDIAIASQGLGYIGEPYVSIEGGSGTGATAVANMVDDGTGRGTFKVGSVTVTCPGVNYATTPTVLLKGGGFNIVTAQVGAVTLSANVGGGLTKVGAGTLTLSAANSYTGGTTIAAGTLRLGHTAALVPNTPVTLAGGTLDLNGYTVTNAISGVGGITNGTVVTDLSPAGAGVVGTNALTLGNAAIKGTYVADVSTNGLCDRLSIQGDINLSNLDLQIVNTDALVRGKAYTILSCTGARIGTFKSTNLPDSRWHIIYRADGSVQLVFVSGTLLRVR